MVTLNGVVKLADSAEVFINAIRIILIFNMNLVI